MNKIRVSFQRYLTSYKSPLKLYISRQRFSTKNQIELSKISAVWLRDQCKCPKCFKSWQKSLERLDQQDYIPKCSAIKSVVHEDDNFLHLIWQDGHESKYDKAYLSGLVDDVALTEPEKNIWNSDIIANEINNSHMKMFDWQQLISEHNTDSSSYNQIDSLCSQINQYGFSLIENCPKGDTRAISKIIEIFGGIQDTHLSELNDGSMLLKKKGKETDLGWSTKRIPSHTDFTYMQNPVGLVALHLMKHTGIGGNFALIDSFYVAEKLRRNDPEVYRFMYEWPVMYRYIKPDPMKKGKYFRLEIIDTILKMKNVLTKNETVMDKTDEVNAIHKPFQIKWNPVYMSLIHRGKSDTEKAFEHLKVVYEELENSDENKFYFKPKQGTIILFDNWRLVHQRVDRYTGERIVHCGDISRDDFYRTWQNVANFKLPST